MYQAERRQPQFTKEDQHEFYRFRIANESPLNKPIGHFIHELHQEVKTIEKIKAKTKPIRRKVVIASWSRADINKLKEYLKMYGTDFEAIAREMGKTRDQVKRKFKVLEKVSNEVTECVFGEDKEKSTIGKMSEQIDFQ